MRKLYHRGALRASAVVGSWYEPPHRADTSTLISLRHVQAVKVRIREFPLQKLNSFRHLSMLQSQGIGNRGSESWTGRLFCPHPVCYVLCHAASHGPVRNRKRSFILYQCGRGGLRMRPHGQAPRNTTPTYKNCEIGPVARRPKIRSRHRPKLEARHRSSHPFTNRSVRPGGLATQVTGRSLL